MHIKNLLTAVVLAGICATSASAEQYLGAPGQQGMAAAFGSGYAGTYVGYFSTPAMRDAFRSAAHLTSARMVTAAVAKKDANGRTIGWTVGGKYYAYAYGPVQIPQSFNMYQSNVVTTGGHYVQTGAHSYSFCSSTYNC